MGRLCAQGVIIFMLGLLLQSHMVAAKDSHDLNLAPLDFAESLFFDGDYYRAITEYKRFLFLNPDTKKTFWIKFRIGQSYLLGNQLQAAWLMFSDLMVKQNEPTSKAWASLAAARILYLQGRLRQSLEILQDLDLQQDLKLQGYKHYLAGCAYIRLGERDNAGLVFTKMPANHSLSTATDLLLGSLDRIEDIPQKSPIAAGLLSVVPGLGHIYIGEYAIALTALSWNGLFAFATYDAFHQRQIGVGVLLSVLELLWYSGTIYGAISGANRYNRDARRLYLEQIDKDAGLDIRFPDSADVSNMIYR